MPKKTPLTTPSSSLGAASFDARKMRARAERFVELSVGPAGSLAQDVLTLLDACDEAYERLNAGDALGAKLTLGWPRG